MRCCYFKLIAEGQTSVSTLTCQLNRSARWSRCCSAPPFQVAHCIALQAQRTVVHCCQARRQLVRILRPDDRHTIRDVHAQLVACLGNNGDGPVGKSCLQLLWLVAICGVEALQGLREEVFGDMWVLALA